MSKAKTTTRNSGALTKPAQAGHPKPAADILHITATRKQTETRTAAPKIILSHDKSKQWAADIERVFKLPHPQSSSLSTLHKLDEKVTDVSCELRRTAQQRAQSELTGPPRHVLTHNQATTKANVSEDKRLLKLAVAAKKQRDAQRQARAINIAKEHTVSVESAS